jgi:hypothetical protein
MDPARIFTESLTPRPELENNQGHDKSQLSIRLPVCYRKPPWIRPAQPRLLLGW